MLRPGRRPAPLSCPACGRLAAPSASTCTACGTRLRATRPPGAVGLVYWIFLVLALLSLIAMAILTVHGPW